MQGQITIAVPPEKKLGPAMRALNERQQLFVVACFEQPKRDNTAAARVAGYQGNDNTLRVTAHRLSHDPRIIAALREEGMRRMDMLGAKAIDKLGDVLESATDHKTSLKAIEMVLNRVGFHSRTEHINKNENVLSDIEKVEKITLLAKAMGLDPKALLGRFAPKEVDNVDDGVVVSGGGGSGSVPALRSPDHRDGDELQTIDAEFEEVDNDDPMGVKGLEGLI